MRQALWNYAPASRIVFYRLFKERIPYYIRVCGAKKPLQLCNFCNFAIFRQVSRYFNNP